jgi:eukaryotic-like serine/threonine-protein kinase
MNHEEMFAFLLEFISSNDETLDDIQQDIIRGSLQGMTYETMQPLYSSLRYRSIETIKKIDAPKLWQKLTDIFARSDISVRKKEKIGKKNLPGIVDRLMNQFSDRQKTIVINNQYQVINTIQKQDLETIYLAENLHLLDRPKCVIKQIRNVSSNSKSELEKQAKVLKKLGIKSDLIPQVSAYFQTENYFYLISEYIPGQHLSQIVERTLWSESEIKNFLQDVLLTLELVHEQQIIHGCVTPENLICRESDRRIILINFNLVKCLDFSDNFSSAITVNYYAAPELIIAPQPSSDLYSLGKITIQLLSGLLPTQLTIDTQTLDIILPEIIAVSSNLATILQKMTRYDFRQRYHSAKEILEKL